MPQEITDGLIEEFTRNMDFLPLYKEEQYVVKYKGRMINFGKTKTYRGKKVALTMFKFHLSHTAYAGRWTNANVNDIVDELVKRGIVEIVALN